MLFPYYASLAAGIVLGVAGQIALKIGALRAGDLVGQFTSPYTVLGFGIYFLAAAFYTISIKKIPVSIAFPSVAFSYVLVALIANQLWNEPLGMQQLTGIALIAGGILLLYL